MPLDPPPRDDQGGVIPHDHAGITANDGIIRRISENQIVTDKTGARRISSVAFKKSTGPNEGMSVDLEALIIEAGIDPRRHVTNPHWTGSLRFTAGDLRAETFQIGFDPDDTNPYHGQVWGTFNKPKQRRLQEIATWFVEIPDVAL